MLFITGELSHIVPCHLVKASNDSWPSSAITFQGNNTTVSRDDRCGLVISLHRDTTRLVMTEIRASAAGASSWSGNLYTTWPDTCLRITRYLKFATGQHTRWAVSYRVNFNAHGARYANFDHASCSRRSSLRGGIWRMSSFIVTCPVSLYCDCKFVANNCERHAFGH
jgi:hypothetical protein